MRIGFIGLGAMGLPMAGHLVAAGHEVTGTTRSASTAARLAAVGATPAVVDGLDFQAVLDAVQAVQPDVIVHQMTALASMRFLQRQGQARARLDPRVPELAGRLPGLDQGSP